MVVDCLIAAGDGRAAKKVFRKNKALLEVDGKPIIRHIVETLKSCDEIGQVVVVGPKKKFEAVIGDLDVRIIEQRREDLVADMEETLEAYRRGEVRMGTVDDLMRDLKEDFGD